MLNFKDFIVTAVTLVFSTDDEELPLSFSCAGEHLQDDFFVLKLILVINFYNLGQSSSSAFKKNKEKKKKKEKYKA